MNDHEEVTAAAMTEALTIEEVDRLCAYLMRAELTEGLVLADLINKKFGRSAKRRGRAWA